MYWWFKPTYVPSSLQSPVTIGTFRKKKNCQPHTSGRWMKSTFAYRPFWTDTKGLRTIKWPSTLACHLVWPLKERKVGALLTAVIRVSNGTVRRQAIRSGDPVQPVSATTWSNKGCWVVMSARDMGEPDSYRKKRKGFVFLFFSAEVCSRTMNAPWKSPFGFPSSMRRWRPTEMAPALSPQLE